MGGLSALGIGEELTIPQHKHFVGSVTEGIGLGQVAGCCEDDNERSGPIRGGEF
jgi:hypothetical protein